MIFRYMAVYVRNRDGIYVDKATGEPMALPKRDVVAMPMIISDIPDYISPIDGKLVSGRVQRREDLKRNNCVEWEPSMSPTKGKYKNEAFCKKRGLQVSEEFRK